WHLPLLLLTLAGIGKIVGGVAALQFCPPLGVCAPGDVDDMVWMVIFGLTGVAAVLQADCSPQTAPARSSVEWTILPAWTTYLPFVWLGVAYWLLTSNRSGTPLVTSRILEWGTGAIIGLVAVRQALLLRENTRLYASALRELEERKVIEQALREAQDDLESRVRQRTLALAELNQSLHTEIGERARAEHEIQKLKDFNEGIIRNMGEGVVVQDSDGYITFVNPMVAVLLGYEPAELLRQHWTRVVPPDQQEIVRRADERRRRGEADRYELELVRKDGTRVPVLVAGCPQYENGRFAGFLAVFTDIGERKRAEAELQQSAEDLQGWVDELERRNREVTLLNQMGDLLQTCLSAEEAYGVVSRFGRQLFPGSAGVLYILDSERSVVETAACWGGLPAQALFGPEECWAIRRGQTYSAADPAGALPCKHMVGVTADAYVCVPLLAQGEPIGVLHLRNWPHEAPGTPVRGEPAAAAQLRLAVTAAEHIALSLMNLRLRETLRDQAIRDPLTGLFNRRYMIETLERELHRSRRRATPLGVVMIDMDQLKQVNDTHGHAAGDAVLRRLAGLLQEQTRTDDVACRFGGDEFILILPEASFENTLRRAQELWRSFRDMRVEFHAQTLEGLAISVGVAVYPQDGATPQALLHQADTALYQAKREGRNRVVAASQIGSTLRDAPESSEDASDPAKHG
ncbi:MAG: diguanylate cyclase, partial [Chloroflexi bacterium]|nr:diguanylate cyclase [Chloroflexota bacterium]